MNNDTRHTGGQANKRGNRFEDYFATAQLIKYAAQHLKSESSVRMREQTGQPVDDLQIEELWVDHFFQLKSGARITWGLNNRKLEREFREQKKLQQNHGRRLRLFVVVSDEDRRKSMIENMPEDLKDVTSVEVFPHLRRPLELARQRGLIESELLHLSARQGYSQTDLEQIASVFFLAWVSHEPDREGWCVIANTIAMIRSERLGKFRIRSSWKVKPESWETVQSILRNIPGLRWWTDKGYFEYDYPPTDRGLFSCRCESEEFERFLARVIEAKPKTFEDFERVCP